MSAGKRVRMSVKCAAGLAAALAVGVLIYRMEVGRPRMILEEAGATLLTDSNGMVYAVTMATPDARDEHLRQIAQLESVRSVNLTGSSVTSNGLKHLQSLPNLETLDISETANAAGGLREVCQIASLRVLHCRRCGWVTDDELAGLAHADGLEHLTLLGTPVTDAGIEHVERLSQLRQLSLDSCEGVSDAAVMRLSALPRLEDLSVDNCPQVTEASLREFAAFPVLRSVSVRGVLLSRPAIGQFNEALPDVDLQFNRVDVTDLQPLIDLGAVIVLDEDFDCIDVELDADLSDGHVRPPGTTSYGAADKLMSQFPVPRHFEVEPVVDDEALLIVLKLAPRVRRLTLSNVPITDAGMAIVGRMRELYSLDLSNLDVSDEGLRSLRELTNLGSLKCDDMPLTGETLHELKDLQFFSIISDQLSLAGLSQIGGMTSLRGMTIGGSLPEGGLRSIAALDHLEWLDLRSIHVTRSMLQDIATAPTLRQISLFDATVSPGALLALGELAPLRSVQLKKSRFPPEDVDRLLELRPDVSVHTDEQGWRTAEQP